MMRKVIRKALGWLSLPLLVSACATAPESHGSNLDAFGPRGMANYSYQRQPAVIDQRLFDPHMYMENDATPRWMLSTDRPNR